MSKPIHCPQCSKPVPVSDINMERMVGRCLECNSLFDPSSQLGQPSHFSAPRERPRVDKPKSISITDWGSEFTISRRWWGWHFLFLTVWCVIWDGGLAAFYIGMLSKTPIQWGPLLFPTLHLIAGVCVTYYTIAGYINSTKVLVKHGRLMVTHGPLKWPGEVSLDARDVDQIFVVQKIGSKGQRSYELCSLMKDGTNIKLLSGLPQSEEAVFIEQTLEEHLKIEDRPVEGEHC